MKISVSRHHPLNSVNGKQPLPHLCRQYSTMGGSSVGFSDSPMEKQQLRRGSESDSFVESIHPEDRSQYNLSIPDCKPAMGLDMEFNPTLFWKPMAKEIDKQEQQVRAGPLQAQFHDRRESPRGQAIQVDTEMASKLFIRPSHTKVSPLDDDPESQHSSLSSEHGVGSNSFQSVSENPAKKCVKLLCSFGGAITARPVDGRLRYVGGETHIVSVYNNVGFAEFLFKMAQFYGCPLNFKYQLPGEDLDALVSVTSDDDMQNMMEEYERAIISHGLTTSSGHTSFRLRLFFFSPNSELEVEDVKAVREDVCSSNQAFVDVINKVSRRLHSSPPENEFAGLQHVDATRNFNTNDQIPLLDQLKEGIQYSAAPSSSLTSLNFRKPSYKRPPGLVDLSIPGVHEDFSQVTIEPLKFEGNTNKESSKSSSNIACRQHYEHSNYDPRFSTPMESSKIRNTDVASFPRYVENWINIHHINSSGKLSQPHVHDDLPKTNIGGSLGHWYGTHRLPDAVSSQGEHHLLNQKYVPPFDSSEQSHLQQHLYRHHHGHHQYHHPDPHYDYQHQENQKRLFHHQHQHLRVRQEQRSLYFQNDVDIGQNDHLRQKMNMQQQVHVTQHSKFSYSGHDVYANDHRRSWGPGQHGKPCSTHSTTQFVHGMIPTLPYQLERSPSSPHFVLNDCQIKCACGVQHSQVHRGITVSIREQPYSQWTPASHEHVAHKQALHYSSRFYTNSGCGVYSSTWQQGCPSLSTQAECNEFSSHRLQMHVRYPREFQSKKCQFKITPQYDGSLSENGIDLLAQGSSKQWKHSDCRNCFKRQNQKIKTGATHNVHAEVIDQSLELFLQDRDMDSDTCRVSSVTKASPGIITYTDEEENDAEEIICRVESRLSASLFSEKPDCRESLAAHTDHVQNCREFQIPPGGISGSSKVRSEVLTHSASSWHLNLSLIRDSEVQNHCSLPPSEPGHQFNMLPFEQSKISFRMDKSTNFLPKSDLAAINLRSTSNMVVEGLEHIDGCGIFPMANNENDGEAISTLFCGDDSHNVARKVRIDNIIHHCVTSDFELVEQSDDALSWYAAYGNYQISPDVISFDHETLTSMASSVTHNTIHTKTFPDIDHSESDSTQMAEFSFPAGKSSIPLSETISDKESMMATAVVPESLASSVVYHCSDEVLTLETSILVPDARCTIFHEVLDEMDNIFGKMDPEIISVDINSLNHSGTEVINSTFEIQAILDESENVLDKNSTTECPVENTLVNGRIEAVSSCRTLHNSCKGNVTEKYSFNAYQTKNPSLSEAEVDTAAHGLQIIKSSDLEDMKELGSGTYGTVYHGKWRGSDVAIKRLKPSCFNGPESDRERLITDFWQEACTLGQLHHPNVVAFYGVVPDDLDGNLATVTEYMVNGSLKQVLRKKDRTIDRRKRIFIAMDAAFGMEYLHSKSIVHFDLKCENLLVNMKDAQRPICKVGDFGLSKVKHHTLVSGGVRGTLPWMAPELLSGKNSMVSEKVDVFSFGIVMWELLTGEEPYANMHCGAIIGGIVNNTLRPTIPSWCDPGWRDLMERCWSANPAERPSFTEVSRELRAMAASMNMK